MGYYSLGYLALSIGLFFGYLGIPHIASIWDFDY
jgi:hypothetical protein